MTIGRIEILLIFVLVAGAAWMASQYLPFGSGGARACAPVPLSPEVKAYVDSKIASGAAGQCGDMPKVVGRVASLEARLVELDKFKQMREQIEEKRQQLEQALAAQQQSQEQLLADVRNNELTRLRFEMAKMCSNITTMKGAGEGDSGARPLRESSPMRNGLRPGSGAGGNAKGQ